MEILQDIQDYIINSFQSNPDIWKIVIIPITSAIIGWVTNIIAIKMTFYPVEFIGFELGIKPVGFKGIRAIGWQGIIPSKAAVMAAKAVDLMVGKLIDVKAQFSRMEPSIVALEMTPRLNAMTKDIIDEAMNENLALFWNNLPQKTKQGIYESAAKEFPRAIEVTMQDIKEHIEELFDVKKMVIEELTHDPKLLNEIFLKVGEKEFKFIERSGIYFGFMFGIAQMILWFFVHQFSWSWVLLPIGGVIIGYITNWLALRLIFEPVHPIKVGFWKFQGLFILRQKEVAKEYSKIVSEEILNPPNIFETIMTGPGSDQLANIVELHVRESVDKSAGFNRSLIQLTSGTKTYESIKSIVTQRVMEILPQHIRHIFDYAENALDIENTIRDKMANLPPDEFVGFLRPVFQEDELKLILVGAALGGLAGWLQVLALNF